MNRPRNRFDLTDAATFGGYRMAALAARGLPGFAAQGLVPAIGIGANFASPERRSMIERHLRRADPAIGGLRLRRAVQEAFDSYTRYWLESFRLPYLSTRAVERGMSVEGYDYVTEALELGNGVILALPHLGGWEWAGRWLADRGHGLTAVVEAIEPPELFDWFSDLRRKLGMRIVSLGPSAGREVLAALKRNDVVCLLSDRDIQRTGIEVEFFGETTTIPAGPATSVDPNRCADPADGGVFHRPHRWSPRDRSPAGRRHSIERGAAGRRAAGQPIVGRRAGVLDPACAPPVAPVPTELAQRPRIRRKPQLVGSRHPLVIAA